MSADNWTKCPNCKRLAEAFSEKKWQTAEAAYGSVSAADYRKLCADACAAETPPKSLSLREDYEISVDSDGTFRVSYCCSCQECGFEWKYKHEDDVL